MLLEGVKIVTEIFYNEGIEAAEIKHQQLVHTSQLESNKTKIIGKSSKIPGAKIIQHRSK